MNRLPITICLLLSILLLSCSDKKAEELKANIQSDYTLSKKKQKLSSGSKTQYLQMEETLNRIYVKNLDSIVNTAFSRQLNEFEENELGVISGYKHMFSWLFQSKQSWDDEMQVLSNKYFNSLDVNQEQHALFTDYIRNIKNLREQFVSSRGLPNYTQIDLPKEKITLDSLSEHTRNNIIIEFSTNLFQWFLGLIILQTILLFVDKIAGPIGCLIDIIVLIIIIIISIIMSNSNDSKLLEDLNNQHTQSVKFDSDALLKELDNNSIKFYENL